MAKQVLYVDRQDGELVMVGLRSHLFWHILAMRNSQTAKRKRRLSTSHRIVSMKTTPVPTIPSKDWVKESPGLNTLVNGRSDEMIESPACYTKEIAAARWSLAKSEIFKKGNIRPTKKLWGRFGADIDLTEEEYNQIVGKGVKTKNKMATATIVEKAFKEGRVTLRGETYFPEKKCFSSYEEYNNPDQEICCEI